jgi:hypothetical protein
MADRKELLELLVLSDSLKEGPPSLAVVGTSPEGERSRYSPPHPVSAVEVDLEGEAELYWFRGRGKKSEARRGVRRWRGLRLLLRKAKEEEPWMKAMEIRAFEPFQCRTERRGEDWVLSCSWE